MNAKIRVLKQQKRHSNYFRKRYETNIRQIKEIRKKENLPLSKTCSYEQEVLYLILHAV